MTTTAKALFDILSQVSKLGDTLRLSAAIASVLKYDHGEMAKAVIQVQKLANEVQSNLNDLNVEQAQRQLLQGQFNPFAGLKHFAVYDLVIKQHKNSMLKPATLSQLSFLDMVLQGQIEIEPEIENSDELLEQVRSLKSSITDLNFPQTLHEVLFNRLSQIERTIDNFSVFGWRSVADSVAELMGQIRVYAREEDLKEPEKQQFWTGVRKLAVGTLSGVNKVRKAADDIEVLGDHMGDIGGFLENFTEEG